ncbi:DNA ligase 1-like [Sander lucioperca]|uniref:DNA ligase 1-like n=1 Tax=Sander lucioperca TaxID=283035 RepID=UPI00125D769F|nr:DNA ligase 1-like [Sander lucioperca]
MFRSIFGLKFFARPRSSGDMDSSKKKSKRRSERPSSPEDLNPPTILREHGRRGERPSSSGGTNPSTIMKERRQRGEGPLSCAENKPSITRQQERRDVSSLFSVGTNPSTIMKEHRQKGESPLSCAENKPSITRQQIRRGESPSSSSSEDKQPSTPRRKQAWRGESPPSSSSEDDQPSSTRQRVRRFESPSSSSSEDKQPSTPRRKQAWRGESLPSSSSEDDQPSSTRQQERKDVSSLFYVGTNRKEHRRKDVSSLFYVGTIMKEHRRKGESPLSCAENKPSTTSVRKERKIIEREKQRLEKDGLKRERERCEKMKRKNQEKEKKTFGLLSRIYIWRLNRKIDRIARKIQSTHVDECYLLRHGPLINPKEMAEKEQLLDQRRDLILYKRRQEFKVEKEVRKQRLKVERKEIDVKKMENISELCCNSDSPDMLNLGYGPMPVRSPKLRFVNIYHLREYESNQKNGIKQREVIEGDGKHFRFDKTEVKRRQAWV